jgi:hypothetical protein
MKEMGNLSHDRCYGTDKSTQKSGYGELTRKIPPLEKGDEGGFLKSPLNPSLRKRGMNTPTLSLPLRRGRMKVGGQINQPSHIESVAPLTITSPLGGEDEGEGENTPSFGHPSIGGGSPPRWAKSTAGAGKAFPLCKRGMKGDLKSPLTPLYERGECSQT